MLLKNSFFPMDFGSGGQQYVLDFFSNCKGNKKIKLESESDLVYLAIFDNSSVDFDIEIVGSKAKIDFFGVFVGNIDSKVLISLMANKSFANINLLCIVKADSVMKLDGNLFVAKNLSNVEGYLKQEQLLLGLPNTLKISPILDIHSCDVKTSHGAKIHNLDAQKMFYIMSKGLSLIEAQKLIIKSSLASFFDRILTVNEEDKKDIFQKIDNSIFNS